MMNAAPANFRLVAAMSMTSRDPMKPEAAMAMKRPLGVKPEYLVFKADRGPAIDGDSVKIGAYSVSS